VNESEIAPGQGPRPTLSFWIIKIFAHHGQWATGDDVDEPRYLAGNAKSSPRSPVIAVTAQIHAKKVPP